MGVAGEYEISLALDEYRIAQELQPGNLTYLEDEAALLKHFAQIRVEAQQQGKSRNMPLELTQELARVVTKIEALHHIQEEAAKAALLAKKRDEETTERKPPSNKQDFSELERIEVKQAALDYRPKNDVKATLLGLGAITLLGGVSLTTIGVWNLWNIENRSKEKLAVFGKASGGTMDMRNGFITEVKNWQQSWRRVGTGLTIGGGVISAVGIGLTIWSIIRIGRMRIRARRVRGIDSTLSIHGPGAWTAGSF